LVAQRWDLDSMQLEGEPVVIAQDVRSGGPNGRNSFTVSSTGVLAYRSGGAAEMRLTWYTRDGKPAGTLLEGGEYGGIRLSADDARLVVVRGTADDRDLWLKDVAGGANGVFSRLTLAPGAEISPVWFPDSSRVIYVGRNDGSDVLLETVIGTGKHTIVPMTDTRVQFPLDVTPDGKQVVLRAGRTISLLPFSPGSASKGEGAKPQPIFEDAYNVDIVRVSPDGKWVAYTSQESGRAEVNLASFPAFGDRRQISTTGGVQPTWRADGQELFFVTPTDQLMAVDVVTAGTTLRTGAVRMLFQTSLAQFGGSVGYAVSRDGQKFLIREPPGRASGSIEQLYIVTNWTSLVGL